jgi:hypothetical protein
MIAKEIKHVNDRTSRETVPQLAIAKCCLGGVRPESDSMDRNATVMGTADHHAVKTNGTTADALHSERIRFLDADTV